MNLSVSICAHKMTNGSIPSYPFFFFLGKKKSRQTPAEQFTSRTLPAIRYSSPEVKNLICHLLRTRRTPRVRCHAQGASCQQHALGKQRCAPAAARQLHLSGATSTLLKGKQGDRQRGMHTGRLVLVARHPDLNPGYPWLRHRSPRATSMPRFCLM